MFIPEMKTPGTIKVKFGLLNLSPLFITDSNMIPGISIVRHLTIHHLECLNYPIQIPVTHVLYPYHFKSLPQIEKDFQITRSKLNSTR